MKSGGAEWDLVVAGAGPAGCALAAKVASAGARVLVLEQAKSPGEGRGWIVDVERTAFAAAGVPEPGPDALWPAPGRQVMVSSDRASTIDLQRLPVVPVRNDLYVGQLARWAESAGAVMRTGCTAVEPLIGAGAVTGVRFLDGDAEEVARSHVAADCTGMSGVLRRKTPAGWGLDRAVKQSDIVIARREVWSIDRDAARAAAADGRFQDDVRVDRAGAAGSYSIETCHVDISRSFVDVLVGVKPVTGLPGTDEHFETLMRGLGFAGERIFGGGAPIPIGRALYSFVGDGLVVLGDSAGQVIPMHGSGTASALIAADHASRAVLGALRRGAYDSAALWSYCRGFQSGRGSVLAYYYVIRRHSESLSVSEIDRMISRGILAASDVRSGLVPEPFSPNPVALGTKLVRGLGELGLLTGFARAGMTATRMKRHYRRYPDTYSAASLANWIKSMPGHIAEQ